ncbi:MAG: MBL fold metallo-hydrolase [Anaerolineae bacterium]|nr:MBL fold metallo-hydrolase [Anaerolineae bacterium]
MGDGTLEVVMLTLGKVQTNCFIVGDKATGSAVVIDPSDNAPLILQAVESRGWTVRDILVTHAHFDHVLAVDDLRAATGAPFRLHEADVPLLQMMQLSGHWFGLDLPPGPEPDGFVQVGEPIMVDGIRLDVRFTPGHAPGHVSYVLASEQIVFSGDCLFRGSIGRTDLPGCDHAALLRSITEQLLPLGDAYTVAPGHMGLTTIGNERQHNPFLQDYDPTGA